MGLRNGNHLSATNVSLRILIPYAFEVKYFQVFGGPAWLTNDRFDISAKAEPEVVAKAGMAALLRQLLEERFALKAHREMRELPVYSLVMAGKTVHLRSVPENDCIPPAPGTPPPSAADGKTRAAACGDVWGTFAAGVTSINGRRVPIPRLADMLEGTLDRTVIDDTNLKGFFDFDLHWSPEAAPSGTSSAPESAPDSRAAAAAMLSALRDQLGLAVKSTKRPVEVIVIDSVEKPSGN